MVHDMVCDLVLHETKGERGQGDERLDCTHLRDYLRAYHVACEQGGTAEEFKVYLH
jgi:hypothetical protein